MRRMSQFVGTASRDRTPGLRLFWAPVSGFKDLDFSGVYC